MNVGDSCVCKRAMGLASNNGGSVKLRPARIMHASIRLRLSLVSLAKNDTPSLRKLKNGCLWETGTCTVKEMTY